jgi:hypothetical protein
MATSTRRLLTVFLSLLVVTIVWNGLERRGTTSRERTFEKVDIERITQIEVSGKGTGVTLSRQGGIWMVTEPVEYPANETLVEDMLTQVDELAVTNLVSTSPANHDLYEVGPDTGVLVRLLGGRDGQRRLAEFYIGKMTSDFGHTYIRRFAEDEVFMASGLLQGYFNKTVSGWRDKTILSLEIENIEQVELSSSENSWLVARRGVYPETADAPWVIRTDGEFVPADSTAVITILHRLINLSASDFPSPAQPLDFNWDDPDYRIMLGLTGDIPVGINVWLKEGENSRVWVKKDGDETVFIMYKSTFDVIAKQSTDLISNEGF